MTKVTKEKKEKKPTSRRRLSPKAFALVFVIVIVIALVIFGVYRYRQWRNNGAAYAQSLAEQIGVSPETAQKYAKITLQTTSEYACINMAAQGYDYLYESKNTVQVSGVNIPEWLILVKTQNNSVTEVVYYDYNQLQKYGNGVKTKNHILTDGATSGMAPETVQEYVGFAPLCTIYTNHDMTQLYKYYYMDKNSKDTVSYILTAEYEDNALQKAYETENYFILDDLTVKGRTS